MSNLHRALAWIDDELSTLDERGLRRRLGERSSAQGVRVEVGGRQLINFGANDYLGLAADPRLSAAVAEATRGEGWGAGASPLVTGRGAMHSLLESRLAEFERTQAALLFSSGYVANMGTICALVGRGDAIYGDEKNHASIIDGCRLSRAEVNIYPHRDTESLQRMLARDGTTFRRRLIVTDSVFSMDGDLAALDHLADLAERYDCMLMVDEAHASGVFGPRLSGLAEAQGVERRVDVRVGTLSKAFGASGGFVSGSRPLIDWLVNRARPYVFSTAPPAAACAAALAALTIMEEEPERGAALLARAELLRGRLREQGWHIGDSASQIIPLVVNDPLRAVELSAALRERGFLVPAIRPPSVARDQSLLRISLSWAHSPQMLDGLAEALQRQRAAALEGSVD